MKKDTIIKRLEANGYKVIFYLNGGVQATKGQRTYKAETLNRLYIQIYN